MQRSQSWIIPTVMSPEKGGPVYNQLRANFAYTRRMIQRHPFRWINDNWDFERQALVNVPEPNLEIRKNQWMHFVDAAYWDGIVGRVFQDFMIYMLGYPALAWLLYAMWWRFKLNDKHNFRKKWRDIRANSDTSAACCTVPARKTRVNGKRGVWRLTSTQ